MEDGLGKLMEWVEGRNGRKGITAAWKAPLLEFEARHAVDGIIPESRPGT
jgi:hypothetical protein